MFVHCCVILAPDTLAYASRSLRISQRRYCTTRREMLAAVVMCTHFRSYLRGSQFLLRTDHSSLRWLQKLFDKRRTIRFLCINCSQSGFNGRIWSCSGTYISGRIDAVSRAVLIVNPNAEEVVLPCGSRVGRLVPVSAVSVTHSELRLPTNTAVVLPEYLEDIVGGSHASLGDTGRQSLRDLLHRYEHGVSGTRRTW